MTNLEFIEKEIKKRIDNISAWGKLLKDDPNDKFSARCLNKYKEELEVLFKIKSELEAWGVVQGTIVEGQDGDGHYCYIETVYFTGEKGEKVTKGLYNDETR